MRGLMLLSLLLLLPGAASYADPPAQRTVKPITRITLQPSPLAELVGRQAAFTARQRAELAMITLQALTEAYRDTLEQSTSERASTPQRRAKLARWQRATARLVDQWDRARDQLAAGLPVQLQTDPLGQVLLIVAGQPIAVSGPNPQIDRQIESRILGVFCADQDCGLSDAAQRVTARPDPDSTGVWVLTQRLPPAFEIDDTLRCEFADIADRQRKAQACNMAATDLRRLSDALGQARRQGHAIDWDRLAASIRSGDSDVTLVVNGAGAYLALELPHLAGLAADDWQRLIRDLGRHGPDTAAPVTIREADRLLSGRRTDR